MGVKIRPIFGGPWRGRPRRRAEGRLGLSDSAHSPLCKPGGLRHGRKGRLKEAMVLARGSRDRRASIFLY